MAKTAKRYRLRTIAIALVTVVGLGALVWAWALSATDYSQFARAIVWLQSDVDDYKRFPLRAVTNAAPVFNFAEPTADMRKRVAPVFDTGFAEFLRDTDTMAFLVIKDDVLLYENYFNGYSRDSTVTSFSVAKSFVSALVGIAIAEGYIDSVEDPVTKYVPELLETDARYEHITLRHLLTMSSGIRYNEWGTPWSDDTKTYYSPNMRALAVSSPIIGEPGERFHYNNYHPLLLGLVLERTTGRHVAQYLEEKLWQPLGMEAAGSWSLDSKEHGFAKMESGINGRAIDFAKFGRLFLRRGDWNGVQLIPADWVDESTRYDTATDPAGNYQYLWWVNRTDADTDHFYAMGKYGQFIYVVPEHDLIFVRFGRTDPYGYNNWVRLFETKAAELAALGQ